MTTSIANKEAWSTDVSLYLLYQVFYSCCCCCISVSAEIQCPIWKFGVFTLLWIHFSFTSGRSGCRLVHVLWLGSRFDLQCIQKFPGCKGSFIAFAINYTEQHSKCSMCTMNFTRSCVCVCTFLTIHINNRPHWKRPNQPLQTSKWILFVTVLCRWYTEVCLKAKSLYNSLLFLKRSFISLLWSVTHFALFHPLSVILRYYFSTAKHITHCRLLFLSVASYTQLCPCSRPVWGQTLVWAPAHFSDLTWILTLPCERSAEGAWIIHESIHSILRAITWPRPSRSSNTAILPFYAN